jgi:hypothetical protein
MKYIIKDWAGNEMPFGEFETAEDAWEYLYIKFEHIDNEEDLLTELSEYFVDKKT